MHDDDDIKNMNEYELAQVKEIALWKSKEPSVVNKAFGFVSIPVVWLINKVIPQAAIEGSLHLSNTAASAMTDTGDILRDGKVATIRELRSKDLQLCDELADSVHNWAVAAATVEGGGTGALGLPGLTADIPLFITWNLRTIQKIGLCYGYECKSPEDQNFCFGILSAAGANTLKEKTTALLTLKTIEVMLAKTTWKAMANKAAMQNFSKEAAVVSIRGLAKQLGVNITKRKALQAIPVIGAAVGASVNGWFIREVGWAARRAYQERWLLDNHKTMGI
jgi:hypothetical protein